MGKLRLDDVPDYSELLTSIVKSEGKVKLKHLAFLSVLAFTGCRIGEAINLKWDDMDFKGRTVKIRQEKKKGEFLRKIPVPSDFFWSLMGRLKERRRGSDRPFDFTQRNGRYVVYSLTKKLLKKRYRPHAIRHSYATYIMKKTKDLEVVRRLLGHSDYAIIRAYMNYSQEDLESELRGALSQAVQTD